MNRHTSLPLFVSLLSIAILLSACGTASAEPAAALPATALPTVAPPTATYTPVPPTITPAPTNTPIPAPTNTPTTDPAVLAATQAAEAQAAAIAAIEPDMKKYGFSTDQGSLGWVEAPVTIQMEKYQDIQSVVDYPDVSVADFVVQSDITWNSTSGLAGCGFVFRQDTRSANEYRFLTVRLSGAPVWLLWLFENDVFKYDIAGARQSRSLDIGQDSTNKVALVGQASKFTVYINGAEAGSASYNGPRAGAVGLYAEQESGKTTCKFENSWLWVLHK